MNFMSILQMPFTAVIFYILPYLLALIVIVFVHEFGHFYVGRLCGVNIETFSVGFGKEIFGFNDRHGTRWKFCWIPLGGYVRFEGDANAASLPNAEASQSPGSLHAAKLWKRIAIVAAGPLANFLFAIAIFTTAYTIIGAPFSEPRVDTVLEDGAGKAAGLQSGDIIRKIDGQNITSFFDIQKAMILRGETPLALEIDRGGATIKMTITPRIKEIDDGFGNKTRASLIGFAHDSKKDTIHVTRLSLPAAFSASVEQTWFYAATTLRYIGKILMGAEKADQLNGPVGVAQIAGDVASHGIWPFITFIGVISVSIGLVNLFPIPMLDGGHLVFYFIEGLFRKPINQVAQEWSFRIGLSAILVLMLFVTKNDLVRLVARHFGT
jgi:regulator of sigma E protease